MICDTDITILSPRYSCDTFYVRVLKLTYACYRIYQKYFKKISSQINFFITLYTYFFIVTKDHY